MNDPILTAALVARGFSHGEIDKLRRSGDLDVVRRGAVAYPDSEPKSSVAAHRQLVTASAELRGSGAVVSHVSAGLFHGLPAWPDNLERAHFTLDQKSGGRRSRWVHVHTAPLAGDEVIEIDGLPVTSLPRTVIDLARTFPYRRAVAVGDAALARGLPRDDLRESLARAGRRHGVGQAHRVIDFLDGRSESVGESYSRVVLDELGMLPTELQYEVFDELGVLVGASDFGWPEHKTLAEFDGKIKYGALLKPGQTASDVVVAEKLREDRLRDLGWQVVRWIWRELATPWVIRERLERAFARSRR